MADRALGTVIESLARHYTLRRLIGRGGSAITYEAEDADGGLVVIKELRLDAVASWKAVQLFEREARALARIDHPRVPRYLDAFVHDETGRPAPSDREQVAGSVPTAYFLVQSKVDGQSIAERVESRGTLDAAGASAILRALLDVLAYLHATDPPIIHRDITPKNVVLGESGAWLVDFGAVQDRVRRESSMASTSIGTVGYAPQEQWVGTARPATDLYGLGMTVLFSMTGCDPSRLPYDDKNDCVDVDAAIPTAPASLRETLSRMTEPRLARRLATAAEARAVLDGRFSRASARRLARASAVAFVAFVALGVGGVAGLKFSEPRVRLASAEPPRATGDEAWFAQIRANCNSVEVDLALARDPAPKTGVGQGYAAACYALAGKIDDADRLLRATEGGARSQALYTLFNVIHPVADQGDDRAAGRVMKLIVRYWPENYMAMYHLGMAEYATDELPESAAHLERFLDTYSVRDGFHATAETTLAAIRHVNDADCRDSDRIATDPEGRPVLRRCRAGAAAPKPPL